MAQTKEYHRQWREKNREHYRDYQREYKRNYRKKKLEAVDEMGDSKTPVKVELPRKRGFIKSMFGTKQEYFEEI
jgi:hypothetical protein